MICNNIKKNIKLNQIFNIDISQYFVKSKLHEICSYIAMYPPNLVYRLIERYTKPGDSICDPFSGRGTTLLETRINNRIAYASDLNPLSYVLTRSKSCKIDLKKIFCRIDELENKYNKTVPKFDLDDYEYMKVYFSFKVYKQLVFISNVLGKNWKKIDYIDNFILACCLGILHGPCKKDGSSNFLSISMSNTNAMSRNYVEKYAKLHNLLFPTNENVFDKIRNKCKRVLCDDTHFNYNMIKNGHVKIGNALNLIEVFPNKKFDSIITSPPYLNIFNYTRENWIRLWLLGYSRIGLSKNIHLDDSHKYNEYKIFLTNFFKSAEHSLKDTGTLIMILGDVENKYKFLNLWNEIKNKTNFKMIDHYLDYKANLKSTKKNGNRAGQATKVDNICVFKRI